MKKVFSFVLMVALTVTTFFTFAACGNSGVQSNFDIPENGYDGSEVTVRFYHTMGSNLSDVLNLYITEFNKLYPNIHINANQEGGYDDVRDKVKTELASDNRTEANIAYCYPDHVALYNIPGAVVTLDGLIESKIEVNRADGSTEILGLTSAQKSDFIEGYYDEGKSFGDGLMYTMPFSKSTEVLYYNKTFFDTNSLSVPTHWWCGSSCGENCTTSMEYVCRRIKEIDPDCFPLGYDSEANWFITMCEQLGSDYTSATGEHFLFDNDTNYDFVKRFSTWYDNGYVTTQELYGAYTSGLFVNQDESKQTSYMSIGSSAGATHQRPDADANGNYPFEVGIASIPQANPSNPKVISQGPSICIFKKDNPQEVIASWLFVKYLTTSVEFQAEFSMASGYVPVLKSVANNAVYKKFTDGANGGSNIAALSAKVCLEQANAYYTSPAFNGSSVARDEVGALLTKCLPNAKGDLNYIKNAFKDAIDECEYAL